MINKSQKYSDLEKNDEINAVDALNKKDMKKSLKNKDTNIPDYMRYKTYIDSPISNDTKKNIYKSRIFMINKIFFDYTSPYSDFETQSPKNLTKIEDLYHKTIEKLDEYISKNNCRSIFLKLQLIIIKMYKTAKDIASVSNFNIDELVLDYSDILRDTESERHKKFLYTHEITFYQYILKWIKLIHY